MNRGAFTLVELLVVIGIIALLISILLPSLQRARMAAMKTQDLSNIRQAALACISYAGESRGRWPRGERGNGFGTGIGSDDLSQMHSSFFDVLIRFNGSAPDATSAAQGGVKVPAEKLGVISCNAWLYDSPMSEKIADLAYYGGTGQRVQAGWVYWGGRNPDRVYKTTYNPDGTPTAKPYTLTRAVGDRPTTRTLLTCYNYASVVYGTMLPHYGKSYSGLGLAGSSQPFQRTAEVEGMCMSYTDGSARFVHRDDFGAMEGYSKGWTFYDRTAE
ncbi:prepilin-type N-terminal cleavage/methylation domain-containing protein [Humisphaera borealis]|uniref:Prepilin-type N-terminal cleavage/methylation domain-containing protein n=2 Tax=Humisphaera borealis TaxID=2807512 RepID=A0A7M2X5M6_9BACT|nr:prepilin-type N-terminal cleavage/methylation domain-containing protein [Humisphaera borealis]